MQKQQEKTIFTEDDINKYLLMIGEIPTKYGMSIIQTIQIDFMKKREKLKKQQEKR